MRWDHLHHDADSESHALPGMQDPAVLRRFDAPEALDMRFYEIQAKTVLNRVPGQSKVPFNWTVNPYRGCSHACTYCLDPATPVLLADGRLRAVGELEPGDAIYGTRRDGDVRRYVETVVLDRWSTRKPAFAIRLENGTTVVASGDHRFLTDGGWRYVADAPPEAGERRPHLRPGSLLLGPGGFTETPERDDAYRGGYVCGVTRGNAHVGTYAHDRGRRGGHVVHRAPLADDGREALARTHAFLVELGVPTEALAAPTTTADPPSERSVAPSLRATVDRMRDLMAWPERPCPSWQRGFLAGIFDTAGSCDGPLLRIAGTDEVLRRTAEAAHALGFDVARERPTEVGAATVRIYGDLDEQLRFFLTVDPAVRHRCRIAGRAVKRRSLLRIAEIVPVGVRDLCDVTTGSGDFVAAGVVSHNCFARPTHEYLNFNPGRDFEREIVVKVNAPERLRADLARRARTAAWGETVALGTNTDPYQWVESKYRLMPGIWAALRDARVPASVLTKSPLLLRDLDLMLELRDAGGFEAALSVPSLDERAWRTTEPHTPHPRTRLAAVAELNRVGIPTAVLAAPLMPGINDAPEQIEALLGACTDAGATNVRGIGLQLRGSTRSVFLEWLADARPDLVPLYEELYRNGPYLPRAEANRLSALVRRGEDEVPPDVPASRALRAGSGRTSARFGAGTREPRRDRPGAATPTGARAAPRAACAAPVQESLF